MATAFQPSTPPRPSSIRTPDTPRWGYDDDYQPYTPRKSARVMQRSREAKTPPPPAARQTTKKPSVSYLSAPSSSPPTANKKRTHQNNASERRVSGALTFDTTLSAASSLGLGTPSTSTKKSTTKPPSAIRNTAGMLPTPSKTPVDRPEYIDPDISSVARTLFPVCATSDDEVMPTPKRGKPKYKMLSLATVEEEGSRIDIYTDCRDRVPEVDLSADNPFYSKTPFPAPAPDPMKAYQDKHTMIKVPGEGEQSIAELSKRTDGMIYVFRGKKVFRKFKDVNGGEESDSEYEAANDMTLTSNLHRPLTRSSYKPRMLFPNADQLRAKAVKDSEEADTDVEELAGSLTPVDQIDEAAATPKAPRFGPFTPPTTARTTRSKKVDISNSPADAASDDESLLNSPLVRSHRYSKGAVNPFDQSEDGKRVKSTLGGKGHKREGDILTGGVVKKPRRHSDIF
ncbi:hypothetical protein LZ554_005273 [Drepanopeziza brunnea f. sp. 'monogermtubi']|nr:hypothetical protein LZ554_005273 [Drepanopeziza brunnea f. sp. 'monogermtubi']